MRPFLKWLAAMAFAMPVLGHAQGWLTLSIDPTPIYAGGWTSLSAHAGTGEPVPWGTPPGCDACTAAWGWTTTTVVDASLSSGHGESQAGAGPWTVTYPTPGHYAPSATAKFESVMQGWVYSGWYQEVTVWDDCAIFTYPQLCYGGWVTRQELRTEVTPITQVTGTESVTTTGQLDVLALPPSGPGPVPGSFQFTFTVAGGQRIFIDPAVAIGYRYHVDVGPKVASVLVPTPLANGDSLFELVFAGQSFALAAGTAFDIAAQLPGGVSDFSILDISTAEALDPQDPMAFVVGLTFIADGEVTITQTAVVPEPGTFALLALGVSALVGWRGLRRLDRT